MIRRSVPLFTLLAVSSIAIGAAPAQSVPAAPPQTEVDISEILPDAEIDVQPCCRPRVDDGADPLAAPLAAVGGAASAPPEGLPVSEEEVERMREAARRRSPLGRSLEEVAPVPASAAIGVAPGGDEREEPIAGPPRLSNKFNGIHFGQSGGFVPPDTQIGAGPDQLLQAVNSVIQLTDKKGKKAITRTANEHWGEDPDEFLFDPKVVYDPLSERFFLIYLLLDDSPRRSFIMLSVSRSSTPETLDADDWCNYKIKSKKGPTWADYPGLGMNGSWVAISTNNFKFGNNAFKQSHFWVMEKAAVVDNEDSCPGFKTFRLSMKRDDDGRIVFNPQVAQHQTESGLENDPLFALNTQFLTFSDQYVLWRISQKPNRDRVVPRATLEQVTSEGYAFPPDATQKGSTKTVDAGDVRVMQQLVFHDGALWAIHGSGCVFEEEGEVFGCLRVARIRPDDDGAEIDFEDLFGKRDHFLFWPGIGVAPDGDVVALFQMSGARRRLTASFNGMRNGADRFGPLTALADEFDRIKDLSKGKCPTELPSSAAATRTGDYVGLSPDPSGEGIWIAAEFAARTAGTCAWKTKVALADY